MVFEVEQDECGLGDRAGPPCVLADPFLGAGKPASGSGPRWRCPALSAGRMV